MEFFVGISGQGIYSSIWTAAQRECAMQQYRQKTKSDGAVTLADLERAGLSLTVHCRQCGHWSEVLPAALALPMEQEIPGLDGVFRCSICSSRDSCAMPLYPRKKPGNGE
ncbi:MAG: hypothetical protein KDJ67_17065 [Nitratireductor sp.]|nr:hypothetical protein [Nitratireductor sp.]